MVTLCKLMGRIRDAVERIVKGSGYTHAELARKMACSRAQVSHLLSGERELSEKWILRFCDALGIGLADLDVRRSIQNPAPELARYTRKLRALFTENPTAFRVVSRTIDDWSKLSFSRSKAPPQARTKMGQ